MNSEIENSVNPIKTKHKSNTDYLRIRKETKRRILSDLVRLNRKDFGKAITPDHYISMAISLLNEEHLEQLRAQSLTNKDRLDLKYKEYCNNHGKISMDEFIGTLIK